MSGDTSSIAFDVESTAGSAAEAPKPRACQHAAASSLTSSSQLPSASRPALPIPPAQGQAQNTRAGRVGGGGGGPASPLHSRQSNSSIDIEEADDDNEDEDEEEEDPKKSFDLQIGVGSSKLAPETALRFLQALRQVNAQKSRDRHSSNDEGDSDGSPSDAPEERRTDRYPRASTSATNLNISGGGRSNAHEDGDGGGRGGAAAGARRSVGQKSVTSDSDSVQFVMETTDDTADDVVNYEDGAAAAPLSPGLSAGRGPASSDGAGTSPNGPTSHTRRPPSAFPSKPPFPSSTAFGKPESVRARLALNASREEMLCSGGESAEEHFQPPQPSDVFVGKTDVGAAAGGHAREGTHMGNSQSNRSAADSPVRPPDPRLRALPSWSASPTTPAAKGGIVPRVAGADTHRTAPPLPSPPGSQTQQHSREAVGGGQQRAPPPPQQRRSAAIAAVAAGRNTEESRDGADGRPPHHQRQPQQEEGVGARHGEGPQGPRAAAASHESQDAEEDESRGRPAGAGPQQQHDRVLSTSAWGGLGDVTVSEMSMPAGHASLRAGVGGPLVASPISTSQQSPLAGSGSTSTSHPPLTMTTTPAGPNAPHGFPRTHQHTSSVDFTGSASALDADDAGTPVAPVLLPDGVKGVGDMRAPRPLIPRGPGAGKAIPPSSIRPSQQSQQQPSSTAPLLVSPAVLAGKKGLVKVMPGPPPRGATKVFQSIPVRAAAAAPAPLLANGSPFALETGRGDGRRAATPPPPLVSPTPPAAAGPGGAAKEMPERKDAGGGGAAEKGEDRTRQKRKRSFIGAILHALGQSTRHSGRRSSSASAAAATDAVEREAAAASSKSASRSLSRLFSGLRRRSASDPNSGGGGGARENASSGDAGMSPTPAVIPRATTPSPAAATASPKEYVIEDNFLYTDGMSSNGAAEGRSQRGSPPSHHNLNNRRSSSSGQRLLGMDRRLSSSRPLDSSEDLDVPPALPPAPRQTRQQHGGGMNSSGGGDGSGGGSHWMAPSSTQRSPVRAAPPAARRQPPPPPSSSSPPSPSPAAEKRSERMEDTTDDDMVFQYESEMEEGGGGEGAEERRETCPPRQQHTHDEGDDDASSTHTAPLERNTTIADHEDHCSVHAEEGVSADVGRQDGGTTCQGQEKLKTEMSALDKSPSPELHARRRLTYGAQAADTRGSRQHPQSARPARSHHRARSAAPGPTGRGDAARNAGGAAVTAAATATAAAASKTVSRATFAPADAVAFLQKQQEENAFAVLRAKRRAALGKWRALLEASRMHAAGNNFARSRSRASSAQPYARASAAVGQGHTPDRVLQGLTHREQHLAAQLARLDAALKGARGDGRASRFHRDDAVSDAPLLADATRGEDWEDAEEEKQSSARSQRGSFAPTPSSLAFVEEGAAEEEQEEQRAGNGASTAPSPSQQQERRARERRWKARRSAAGSYALGMAARAGPPAQTQAAHKARCGQGKCSGTPPSHLLLPPSPQSHDDSPTHAAAVAAAAAAATAVLGKTEEERMLLQYLGLLVGKYGAAIHEKPAREGAATAPSSVGGGRGEAETRQEARGRATAAQLDDAMAAMRQAFRARVMATGQPPPVEGQRGGRQEAAVTLTSDAELDSSLPHATSSSSSSSSPLLASTSLQSDATGASSASPSSKAPARQPSQEEAVLLQMLAMTDELLKEKRQQRQRLTQAGTRSPEEAWLTLSTADAACDAGREVRPEGRLAPSPSQQQQQQRRYPPAGRLPSSTAPQQTSVSSTSPSPSARRPPSQPHLYAAASPETLKHLAKLRERDEREEAEVQRMEEQAMPPPTRSAAAASRDLSALRAFSLCKRPPLPPAPRAVAEAPASQAEVSHDVPLFPPSLYPHRPQAAAHEPSVPRRASPPKRQGPHRRSSVIPQTSRVLAYINERAADGAEAAADFVPQHALGREGCLAVEAAMQPHRDKGNEDEVDSADAGQGGEVGKKSEAATDEDVVERSVEATGEVERERARDAPTSSLQTLSHDEEEKPEAEEPETARCERDDAVVSCGDDPIEEDEEEEHAATDDNAAREKPPTHEKDASDQSHSSSLPTQHTGSGSNSENEAAAAAAAEEEEEEEEMHLHTTTSSVSSSKEAAHEDEQSVEHAEGSKVENAEDSASRVDPAASRATSTASRSLASSSAERKAEEDSAMPICSEEMVDMREAPAEREGEETVAPEDRHERENAGERQDNDSSTTSSESASVHLPHATPLSSPEPKDVATRCEDNVDRSHETTPPVATTADGVAKVESPSFPDNDVGQGHEQRNTIHEESEKAETTRSTSNSEEADDQPRDDDLEGRDATAPPGVVDGAQEERQQQPTASVHASLHDVLPTAAEDERGAEGPQTGSPGHVSSSSSGEKRVHWAVQEPLEEILIPHRSDEADASEEEQPPQGDNEEEEEEEKFEVKTPPQLGHLTTDVPASSSSSSSSSSGGDTSLDADIERGEDAKALHEDRPSSSSPTPQDGRREEEDGDAAAAREVRDVPIGRVERRAGSVLNMDVHALLEKLNGLDAILLQRFPQYFSLSEAPQDGRPDTGHHRLETAREGSPLHTRSSPLSSLSPSSLVVRRPVYAPPQLTAPSTKPFPMSSHPSPRPSDGVDAVTHTSPTPHAPPHLRFRAGRAEPPVLGEAARDEALLGWRAARMPPLLSASSSSLSSPTTFLAGADRAGRGSRSRQDVRFLNL